MDGYLTFWFRPQDLGLAFAILHTIGRLGTAAHFVLMPPLYALSRSLALPMWTAFGIYGASMLLCLVVVWLSQVAEEKCRVEGTESRGSETALQLMFGSRFYSRQFWMLATLCGLFYGAMFIFTSIASGVFQQRFHFGIETTGYINVPGC